LKRESLDRVEYDAIFEKKESGKILIAYTYGTINFHQANESEKLFNMLILPEIVGTLILKLCIRYLN
jgi:hypothetical protein